MQQEGLYRAGRRFAHLSTGSHSSSCLDFRVYNRCRQCDTCTVGDCQIDDKAVYILIRIRFDRYLTGSQDLDHLVDIYSGNVLEVSDKQGTCNSK